MDNDEQKIELKTKHVFATPQDKTYGEKRYDFVFGTMINFWANLLVSAGFAFWVTHARNPIKIPFTSKTVEPLHRYQEKLAVWIEKQGIMRGIENPQTRMERSESMAGLFTLLTPGHIILIPSVWLGDKIKPAFIKKLDRKHYGDEAMENPELKARHDAIELGERRSLLGTVVGRLGTILATQAVGRTLGSPDNWANDAGKKIGFKALEEASGVDNYAGKVGDWIGNSAEKLAPTTVGKINDHFTKNNYTWSSVQLKDPTVNTSGPYNQSVQNFTRYVAQDVLYTIISSRTITPIISFAKKFIPGMTYKPDPKPGMDLEHAAQVKLPRTTFPQEVSEVEMAQESPDDQKPTAKITNIQKQATINASPEAAMAHSG